MRVAYLGAVLAATVAVGCGGGDDDDESNADRYEGAEAEVAAVVDEFSEAGREGDGARICGEIFARALARNIEQEAGQSCETEVTENLPEDEYELTVDSLNVKDQAATAAVTDQDDNSSVLHMVKTESGWEVLRVTPSS